MHLCSKLLYIFLISNFSSLPALFGDDHLSLMAVEFEPQRSVTQVNLRPGRGARTRDRHRAQTGARSRIGRVEAPGTLSELIAASKLTPTGAHGG